MTFWTTQRIRSALGNTHPPILNSNPSRVNNACYEMGLGTEAFVTSRDETKRIYKSGDQILIPPGQFGLLLTDEELKLPLNLLAFISIKASKKMSGLVNVSGFHVDPGFQGRLKFSVYNAGSETVVLDVGAALFPIWFYELPEDNEDDYNGKHKGQKTITSHDVELLQGDVASPAELKRQIDELRTSVTNWKAATIGIIGAAITGGFAVLISQLSKLVSL